jgi:insertion element IS1 protein InsB
LVLRAKKQKHCLQEELMIGDCWIGMTQAQGSGLILATRVGKHTDELIAQLVINTEGKTDCQQRHTDGWGGYERVLA